MPAPTDPLDLPGRAVDIVHAAVKATGASLWAISLTFPYGGPEISVHLGSDGPGDEQAGRAVFAKLGVTDPDLQLVPDHDYARVCGDVPVIGMRLVIVVDSPAPVDVDAGDVDALVAGVDARRAAAAIEDDEAHPQPPGSIPGE